MEIEQFLYEFNEAGEAIIAYKMTSATGSVELCNLGASILTFAVADVEIASGGVVRSLTNSAAPQSKEKSLGERIWESWVEGNRVVMSTVESIGECNLTMELIFDFDDENTLEITYQAVTDGEMLVDLTHLLNIEMGGEMQIAKIDSPDSGEIRQISSAQKNILDEKVTIKANSGTLEVLSSHPAIYISDTQPQIAAVTHPNIHLVEGARYIQKTLFRYIAH